MKRGTYGLVVGTFVVTMAVAMVLLIPAIASAWAPAGSAPIHPGVQTYTKGAQCTSNFVFQEGDRRLPRPGRALLGDRRRDRNRRLHQRLATARDPGRSQGRQQTRHAGLQLLAGDAGRRRDRPRHLRLQRLCPDPARPGRRRPGQPLRARLRRPDRVGSAGGLGSTVYCYGNSELRGGITKLSPKQGDRRSRAKAAAGATSSLHPDARRPRRLGQRLHQRRRRGDRRAQHAAAGAAAGHQRRRRPRQGARLRALAQLLQRARSWCRAPAPSKANLLGRDPRLLNPSRPSAVP